MNNIQSQHLLRSDLNEFGMYFHDKWNLYCFDFYVLRFFALLVVMNNMCT